MDFFDDASGQSTTTEHAVRPRRRRPSRRRTRVQRFLVLAAVVVLVVFGLALWVRSCQHNRTVSSYRTYLEGVATAIDDSAKVGKDISRIVNDPTKLTRKQLLAKLDELTARQEEVAARAAGLEPPERIAAQHEVFVTGMKVRAAGCRLLRDLLGAALSQKQPAPARIAAVAPYFTGPDAYYMELFYLPVRTAMADQGVSDVPVPEARYYLTWHALDPARLATMLSRAAATPKLSGIHGVAVLGATARTGTAEVTLRAGKLVTVPASADLAFAVRVQNQGSVAESDVPVVATLTLPDGTALRQQTTIARIAAGQVQTVTLQGFAVPTTALSKVCKLTVKAGPVAGERVASNNSATYRLVLQLK